MVPQPSPRPTSTPCVSASAEVAFGRGLHVPETPREKRRERKTPVPPSHHHLVPSTPLVFWALSPHEWKVRDDGCEWGLGVFPSLFYPGFLGVPAITIGISDSSSKTRNTIDIRRSPPRKDMRLTFPADRR